MQTPQATDLEPSGSSSASGEEASPRVSPHRPDPGRTAELGRVPGRQPPALGLRIAHGVRRQPHDRAPGARTARAAGAGDRGQGPGHLRPLPRSGRFRVQARLAERGMARRIRGDPHPLGHDGQSRRARRGDAARGPRQEGDPPAKSGLFQRDPGHVSHRIHHLRPAQAPGRIPVAAHFSACVPRLREAPRSSPAEN